MLGEDRLCEGDKGKALAAHSTLNRLELGVLGGDARYKKIIARPQEIEALLIEEGIKAIPRKSRKIILDFDATDDPLHGNQEGAFFHGYYHSYCYLPLYCFCGNVPLLARLRDAKGDASSGTVEALEVSISRLAAERYPETIYLQQVSGVGPITSLYFVLKVGTPGRFQRTRDIGAFLGLCPRRDQSGETDKELRISKCGDQYLRGLLVNAAQYILGPFGTDSALREHGLRLAQEGTARAKKRAVVAVARKLAVLLLTLWKSREPYESFPTMA